MCQVSRAGHLKLYGRNMTDGRALLQGVLDTPDEDGPRLVYADWLEENGRREMAVFIRAAIENGDDDAQAEFYAAIAHTRPFEQWRAFDLPAEWAVTCHRPRFQGWFDSTRRSPGSCLTRRGFVEEVADGIRDWTYCGKSVCESHPVRDVHLTSFDGAVGEWTTHVGNDRRQYRFTLPNIPTEVAGEIDPALIASARSPERLMELMESTLRGEVCRLLADYYPGVRFHFPRRSTAILAGR